MGESRRASRIELSSQNPGGESGIDHWRDSFRDSLYPNAIYPLESPDTFAAHFSGIGTTSTTALAGMITAAKTVVSTDHLEAGDVGGFQLIFTPQHGGGHVASGREVSIEAHRLMVEMLDVPRTAVRGATSEVFTVIPDSRRVTTPVRLIRELSFRPLPLPAGLRRLFIETIRNPALEGVSASSVDALFASVSDVILSYFTERSIPPESQAEGLRRLVEDYLRSNYSDPTITADTIAERFHVSRRRIYQVFDGHEPPLRLLRRVRLDHARRIEGSRYRYKQEAVARSVGFSGAQQLRRARESLGDDGPSDRA